MKNEKQRVVVICGPTSSGKTKLALQLAKELPSANILSVDSRQVYQGLDIVTGKDIPTKLSSKIKIYGQGIFSPDYRANLADFVHYANNVISESIKTNTPLIVVGGTGLYLKGITQQLSEIYIPPNHTLRGKLEKMSLQELQGVLKIENPQKYLSLNHSDRMNPRRLIRYIEIAKSHLTLKNTRIDVSPDFKWVGISADKENLKNNIHSRVEDRIKNGAIEEVISLRKEFSNTKLPIFSSLGVSQIIDFLDDKVSKEKMVEIWTNAEVDYARRQNVWFKKQPNIVWYDKDSNRKSLISDLQKIYQQNA